MSRPQHHSPPDQAPLIAIVDIGKSNAKLLVVDVNTGNVVWNATRVCASLGGGPLLQLDIQGIERWLLDSLGTIPARQRVCAIVPIAHGAAAVLLDASGLPLVAPDYEDPQFDSIAAEYRTHRDPFTATFSPELGQGLNLGRQLYYVEQRMPALFERCHHIVLYPQYWAYRLSGVLASEITSLGCHSDLWDVRCEDYADLAEEMDWPLKLPPLRKATESLGAIRPEIAQHGLSPNCQVLCGLHDSNASYLCHLIDRPQDEPFAAISSGTWTVIMARGVNLGRLRPECDMLANVDVFGTPVATARFMGGREYAVIAGAAATTEPTVEALRAVIASDAMALPSFAETGGPFANTQGRLIEADRLTPLERVALATLYVALMTDLLLELLDVRGDLVIDGPLATNSLYGQTLAALRPNNRVQAVSRHSGPVMAALYLAGFKPTAVKAIAVAPLAMPEIQAYRTKWRDALTLTLSLIRERESPPNL